MSTRQNFVERPFQEEPGGYYDDAGFYIAKDGAFWDPDGVFFNPQGFDKYGGYYDDNLVYQPGPGWVAEMQCYEDQVAKNTILNNNGYNKPNQRGKRKGRGNQNNYDGYEEYDGMDGDAEENELAEVFGFDIDKAIQEEDDKFCKKTYEMFFKNKDSISVNPNINNIVPNEKPEKKVEVTNTVSANNNSFMRKAIPNPSQEQKNQSNNFNFRQQSNNQSLYNSNQGQSIYK